MATGLSDFSIDSKDPKASELIDILASQDLFPGYASDAIINAWMAQPESEIGFGTIETELVRGGYIENLSSDPIAKATALELSRSMYAGFVDGYRDASSDELIRFIARKLEYSSEDPATPLGWDANLANAALSAQLGPTMDQPLTNALLALYSQHPQTEGLGKIAQMALTHSGDYFGPIDGKANGELASFVTNFTNQHLIAPDKQWANYSFSGSTSRKGFTSPMNVLPTRELDLVLASVEGYFKDLQYTTSRIDKDSGFYETNWLESCLSPSFQNRCRSLHSVRFSRDWSNNDLMFLTLLCRFEEHFFGPGWLPVSEPDKVRETCQTVRVDMMTTLYSALAN